jgi:hypothetical protein
MSRVLTEWAVTLDVRSKWQVHPLSQRRRAILCHLLKAISFVHRAIGSGCLSLKWKWWLKDTTEILWPNHEFWFKGTSFIKKFTTVLEGYQGRQSHTPHAVRAWICKVPILTKHKMSRSLSPALHYLCFGWVSHEHLILLERSGRDKHAILILANIKFLSKTLSRFDARTSSRLITLKVCVGLRWLQSSLQHL